MLTTTDAANLVVSLVFDMILSEPQLKDDTTEFEAAYEALSLAVASFNWRTQEEDRKKALALLEAIQKLDIQKLAEETADDPEEAATNASTYTQIVYAAKKITSEVANKK